MKKIIYLFLIVLSFFLVSCKETYLIIIDSTDKTYQEGSLIELNPMINNKTDVSFVYTVTDENVVINDDGKLYAINSGSTTIIISTNDEKIDAKDLVVNITVTEYNPVKISGPTIVLVGGNIQINSEIEGVKFESSDENVAEIDEYGTVTGISQGIASIKATLNTKYKDYYDSIKIEVKNSPKVEITGESKVLVGEKISLSCNLDCTWDADNECVSVDDNGVVTGLKEGKATIIATYNSSFGVFYDRFEVDVINKPILNIIGLDSLFVGDKTTFLCDTPNVTWLSLNPDILSIDNNGFAIALKEGICELKAVLTNEFGTFETSFEVSVQKAPSITIIGENTLYVLSSINLLLELVNLEGDVQWTSSDETIATVDNGVVTGINKGNVVITASIGEYSCDFSIVVMKNEITKLSVNVSPQYEDLAIGDTIQIEYTTIPSNADSKVLFSSSNENVLTVSSEGLISVNNYGYCTITVYSEDNINIKQEVDIVIRDNEKPIIMFNDNKNRIVVSLYDEIDLLSDVKANDNYDGDITSSIRVEGNVDTNEYGLYKIKYYAQDSFGNLAIKEREVEVKWLNKVKFIGHAGSYYGLMNSEEAILYAIRNLKYQAVEVDIKQTKDGVFVLSHDDTFANYTIANTNWDVLKNVTKTEGRKAGFPSQNGSVVGSPYTTSLFTLEKFLRICVLYDVKAVIELKSSKGITNTDQSRMSALMEVVNKCNALDNCIFLGSQYNCLIWLRNNGYSDVECQYLVNSCESETALQRCIDYNFSISINVTGSSSNSDEWLARYKENGIKISTYTFTQYVDYPEVQKWIDKGVDYVTCDWHIMSKLNLPRISYEDEIVHTVRFFDYDGTLLKESKVKNGNVASSPLDPKRFGYSFKGWDKSIKNVTSSFDVNAVYDLNTYTITYNDGLTKTSEINLPDRNSFVNEFYNDLFEWFKTNGKNVSGLSEQNGKFTLTKNGVTVSFSSVNDILSIDIYDFEKTISNVIYKPVTRRSDGTCLIEPSEEYFLNSSKYIEKYKNFDAYIVNAINTGYPNYDKTYKPTSAGKIQIFFRFHQWAKGTTIAAFNKTPTLFVVEKEEANYYIENSVVEYNILSDVILLIPTSKYDFIGWFDNSDYTGNVVTMIEKGTKAENIILYAKWNK